MNKIFIALYLYQLQVDEAFHELLRLGVSPEHMKVFSMIGNLRGGYKIATIGTSPDDRFADMKSELFQILTKWGVPKDDAFMLTEGVRRGGKLAVVFGGELEKEKVTQILQSHGALDIEVRKKYYEQALQHPTGGRTDSPFTNIRQESHYANDLATWARQNEPEHPSHRNVKIYETSWRNEKSL